jgi:hypothetical protein
LAEKIKISPRLFKPSDSDSCKELQRTEKNTRSSRIRFELGLEDKHARDSSRKNSSAYKPMGYYGKLVGATGFEPANDFERNDSAPCSCADCEMCSAAHALQFGGFRWLEVASRDAELHSVILAWEQLPEEFEGPFSHWSSRRRSAGRSLERCIRFRGLARGVACRELRDGSLTTDRYFAIVAIPGEVSGQPTA